MNFKKKKKQKWICCQIGAREHYAIPRALQKEGRLNYLFTDSWVDSQKNLANFPFSLLPKLKERNHSDIPRNKVIDFTKQGLRFELIQRIRSFSDWERIINRNIWFQKKTLDVLKQIKWEATAKPILFAYSYAALDILKYAKERGWTTVLGQIDPGITEALLVDHEHEITPHLSKNWQPIPAIYWENWREECSLADIILVNSNWSKEALIEAKIEKNKIEVIPLAYEKGGHSKKNMSFKRFYPKQFSKSRPLKVLFLGQVILRKGIASLLAAAENLRKYPIEFYIIGPIKINIPKQIVASKKIHFLGRVARSETEKFYKQCDIFLLPTISDGFAITQLEAINWKLPIVASRKCGRVVIDGINGRLLGTVSKNSITNILLEILAEPSLLQTWSDNAKLDQTYSLQSLVGRLNEIIK